jgi:hypothetical protein
LYDAEQQGGAMTDAPNTIVDVGGDKSGHVAAGKNIRQVAVTGRSGLLLHAAGCTAADDIKAAVVPSATTQGRTTGRCGRSRSTYGCHAGFARSIESTAGDWEIGL